MNLIINKGCKLEQNIFFEGYYLDENNGIVAHFEDILDLKFVKNNKENLNGLYRVCEIKEDMVEVTVDRYRSLPVFYIENEEVFIIGTDFFELCEVAVKHNMNLTIDDTAANNFIRFGYVPENDTLVKEIKELPSASTISIDVENLNFKIKKYWELEYKESTDFDYKKESKNLEDLYDKIFEDYSKFLNRNKVNVNFAISGGMDSRLILAGVLKYIDDKTRITLNTFGNIYCEDVKIPYELALENDLKINHFSISQYNKVFSNDLVMLKSTYGRSLSHYQDGFPLLEHNDMSKNEIWFFGHSGDFIGGSHISRKMYHMPRIKEEFKKCILNKHSLDGVDNSYYSTSNKKFNNKVDIFSEMDKWDLENRQSRYIINDIASFRYCDNMVLLPLWDTRLVDYFMSVPIKYKVKNVLYNHVSLEYLKKMKLEKHLSKDYYKGASLLGLLINRIKINIMPLQKYILSHGFNSYFSLDYAKNKINKLIKEMKNKGIQLEPINSQHFIYFLSVIDLYKIINNIDEIRNKRM